MIARMRIIHVHRFCLRDRHTSQLYFSIAIKCIIHLLHVYSYKGCSAVAPDTHLVPCARTPSAADVWNNAEISYTSNTLYLYNPLCIIIIYIRRISQSAERAEKRFLPCGWHVHTPFRIIVYKIIAHPTSHIITHKSICDINTRMYLLLLLLQWYLYGLYVTHSHGTSEVLRYR